MASESDNFDLRQLDKLIKGLKSTPKLRVGILGDSKNATIGAVHEFGAPAKGIPQRSFLRIPISEHLEKELEQSGLLNKERLAEVIKTGSMKAWVEQVGVCAVAVVDDAFESSGDGKWPKWKQKGYMNQGGMLLVDSGQLRQSVHYEVTE